MHKKKHKAFCLADELVRREKRLLTPKLLTQVEKMRL